MQVDDFKAHNKGIPACGAWARNQTLKTTLVLLPGLNGTCGLFEPLLKYTQDSFNVLPISYPTQVSKSYSELTAQVLTKLENIKGKYILLGESFSGPIALFASEKKPEGLIGVILVATFISAPNIKIGRYLPWYAGFLFSKPLYNLRSVLSKKDNQSLIAAISTELQKVSPRVLASRISETFTVDATQALVNCSVPIIYFRGASDFVVPKKNLRKILSVKSDVKVVEFNTQHFLLLSLPEQASVEIAKFANDCARVE